MAAVRAQAPVRRVAGRYAALPSSSRRLLASAAMLMLRGRFPRSFTGQKRPPPRMATADEHRTKDEPAEHQGDRCRDRETDEDQAIEQHGKPQEPERDERREAPAPESAQGLAAFPDGAASRSVDDFGRRVARAHCTRCPAVHRRRRLVACAGSARTSPAPCCRQCLAIARAVNFGARALILDEPTAALGVKQSVNVLKLIDRAREKGISVIFTTHNVNHAYPVRQRHAAEPRQVARHLCEERRG